jgi:hypothetical protein
MTHRVLVFPSRDMGWVVMHFTCGWGAYVNSPDRESGRVAALNLATAHHASCWRAMRTRCSLTDEDIVTRFIAPQTSAMPSMILDLFGDGEPVTRNNFRRTWRVVAPVLLVTGVLLVTALLIALPQVLDFVRRVSGR